MTPNNRMQRGGNDKVLGCGRMNNVLWQVTSARMPVAPRTRADAGRSATLPRVGVAVLCIAAMMASTGCAAFSGFRVEGRHVDYRLWMLGDSIQSLQLNVLAPMRVSRIEVLVRTAEGNLHPVWRAVGSSALAERTQIGIRIPYGVSPAGMVVEVAARPLLDGEIYVAYVDGTDDKGKARRAGIVFIASEGAGVDMDCKTIEQCSRYQISTTS